jgi:CRISPR system Cascade subunit CasB
MNTERSSPDRAAQILVYLRSLSEDRGAMANLRCALVPSRRYRAWPLLARVGGIDNNAIETVAGLFAFHPVDRPVGNFGATCRLIADQSRREDGTSTFDPRFTRLLSCSQAELCLRLRTVAFAAKAREIPVNYEELLRNLFGWDTYDWIRIRWAQAYWADREREQAGPEEREEVPS